MRRDKWQLTQMTRIASILTAGIQFQHGHLLSGLNPKTQNKEVPMADVYAFKNSAGTSAKPEDFTFQFGIPTSIKSDTTDGNRRFSGVAYTGDPITGHYYWGTVVFDLSLIQVPDRMAILLNHDGDEIVGYSDESGVTTDGLVLGGILSKVTDAGKEVTALSDEGFPWQMSVRIQPSRIEELAAGATTVVNNRTITGPAYIFRESKLVETSFTPTGWDSGTSATALSRNSNPTSQEDQVSKELEAKVAQLEGELQASNTKNDTLSKELADLKASIAQKDTEARVARVKEAYAKVGKELTEEDIKKFSAMPDDAVTAVIDALSFAKPAQEETLPPGLFAHQADNGKKPEAGKNADRGLLALCDQAAKEFSASRK